MGLMEDYSGNRSRRIRRRVLNNFLKGISYLNIFGNPHRYHDSIHYRTDLTPEQKDAIALSSDWQRVGKDLEYAIKQFKTEK